MFMEIIPGILEKEWGAIEKKIEAVKSFAQVIHIDILDGKFADNTTFLDPKPFKKYTSDILFEVHMMVDNPMQYLQPFADAGFKRFLGHVEKMPDVTAFIAKAQLLGEVGLAIDGPTSLEQVPVPYEDLDALLVMTIKAGFSGQSFTKEHLEKVKKAREGSYKNDELVVFPIEVDGGINDKTIVEAKHAGATRFITTSFLFGKEDPKKQYDILTRLVSDHP
jgi:ribulose-phosphate 3-epimerase